MSEPTRRWTLVLPLAAGLALAAAPAQAQSQRTLTSSRHLWGREPVEVLVEYGMGDLTIAPVSGSSLLYRLEMRYDEQRFTPVTRFDDKTRQLRLGLKSREGRASREGRDMDGTRARLELTREAPLDLELKFGAGEAKIDLGGVRLRRLDVSTGASDTQIRFDQLNPIEAEDIEIKAGAAELEVHGLAYARAKRIRFQGGVGATVLDFSGPWSGNATASVQMGIGAVKLRFPRGLGVRLNKSSLLSSFEADRMVRRGNSYYSANWDSAPHRLTVDVDAAFGSIEVEWVR